MMTMFLLLKQLLAEQFKSENKPNMAHNLKTRNEARPRNHDTKLSSIGPF